MAQQLRDRLRTVIQRSKSILQQRRIRTIALAATLVIIAFTGSASYVALNPEVGDQLGVTHWLQQTGLISQSMCAGLCQGCYCDHIYNGVCYENGRPSGCIGCVGSCTSDNHCACRAGLGGCGPILVWCRNEDCAPQPVPTPVTPPTPTPPPPACNEGEIFLKIEQPAVTWKYEPPYPVAIHQDPTFRGFDLTIDVAAGFAEQRQIKLEQLCRDGRGVFPTDCPDQAWEWSCSEKVLVHIDDPIVNIDLPMRLADSSVEWIDGYLASRYYNAERKEPLPKVFELWEGEALTVKTGLTDYPAQDPGVHGGKIIVETKGTDLSEPQRVALPYSVPVYLRDTTISK